MNYSAKRITRQALLAISTLLLLGITTSCASPQPIVINDQAALQTVKRISVAPFETPDLSSIKWSQGFYLGDGREGFIDGLKSCGFEVVDRLDQADAIFTTNMTLTGYLSIGVCGGWDHYVDGLTSTLHDRKTGKTLLILHHRNEDVKLSPKANGIALATLAQKAWQAHP